jgi:hypothetical protein
MRTQVLGGGWREIFELERVTSYSTEAKYTTKSGGEQLENLCNISEKIRSKKRPLLTS